MKILILTQKIDINDGVLGFFHRWVEKMAVNFEKIEVICLQLGIYSLPSNVEVKTLGKEISKSKIKYIFRFYKYLWQIRNDYDVVFVHMNKEYLLLGGFYWRFSGKKVILWYNHERGNFFSVFAYFLANQVLYTSSYSFFSKFKKAKQMPVGIDTEFFLRLPGLVKEKKSLLFLSRIAPIKNVDILISAAKILHKNKISFVLDIVGDAAEKDKDYFESIKKKSNDLFIAGKIRFFSSVPNHQTMEIYNKHQLYINLTNSGSLDKTILEAMACESVVLVSNKNFEGVLSSNLIFQENNAIDLANKIILILNLPEVEFKKYGEKFRNYVLENHDLNKLVIRLTETLQN